jgi:hypothetical protein
MVEWTSASFRRRWYHHQHKDAMLLLSFNYDCDMLEEQKHQNQ